VNPKHPVVLRLADEEKRFDDWAAVLLDQALLRRRRSTRRPGRPFVKRINQLMLEMSSGGSRISLPG
jgi:molecular chaperone HtpG